MSATSRTQPRTYRPPTSAELDSRLIVTGLVVFAGVQLGLALFMAILPHVFYTSIGPFGVGNDHYVRDVATYNAALGVGLAISVRRVSWRIPVLAVTTVQFALHSVNHLLDIAKADPGWIGYFDFFALAAATLQLVWLIRLAARTSPANSEGDPP